MPRRSPRRHIVRTKHPRYHLPSYLRGKDPSIPIKPSAQEENERFNLLVAEWHRLNARKQLGIHTPTDVDGMRQIEKILKEEFLVRNPRDFLVGYEGTRIARVNRDLLFKRRKEKFVFPASINSRGDYVLLIPPNKLNSFKKLFGRSFSKQIEQNSWMGGKWYFIHFRKGSRGFKRLKELEDSGIVRLRSG